jgi:hypothetical protein
MPRHVNHAARRLDLIVQTGKPATADFSMNLARYKRKPVYSGLLLGAACTMAHTAAPVPFSYPQLDLANFRHGGIVKIAAHLER